ncbi:LysR family transcriptional regulator [Actibacterium pelagium]|uniref:LysR family transcriptional regulator n=1 Tax=Actibacterium pelagium TaxID=2029103 RepID=A0A917EJ98_9RHOB|nr:LysR family transcriptional regulator [Actibacterium pelagium]GGE43682.1 LysR family transcriptional regulator [Actibacterium pelagium]
MNLDLFEDFLELARELNFSRAAAKRNMTQPAFSRRIKSLEDVLQAPLVSRSTRSVTLTPAGEALQGRAEDIVRMIAETRQDVQDAAGQSRRQLNLAVTHALSYTFVPRWLMQVTGPAELGTLNMVSDTQRQSIRLLQAGEVNFLITHMGLDLPSGLSRRQFNAIQIGEDRLVPVCVPLADGSPRWCLGGEDPFPVLDYAEASGLHAILKSYWAAHGRPGMTPIMSSVLAATNLEMAKEGQGVSFLPSSIAEPDLAAGHLVHAGDLKNEVPIRIMIFRSKARLSRHSETFWQRVVENRESDL